MGIVLNQITKAYDDQVVVSGVSLEIQTGELFVLLGASGSGKSTVLRLIAGLQLPDSGTIFLNDKDVTHTAPQKRNVGFVFQNYALFRHMTVAENVEFGLRVRRDAATRRRRRSELLEIVGLTGFESRLASQLSGGQRQRVALARALAYEPSVLLLDEPFGALDSRIRAQLRRSLQDAQRELRVTTILVTHDQEEAFELGHRIGILDRGVLSEVGPPEKLYFSPDTEYTATFLGGGNVLVGRVENGKVRLGANLIPFPQGEPQQEDGAAVRVLFRPESVAIQEQPFDSSGNISYLGEGTVRERVFAGATEKLRIELDSLRGTRPLAPPPLYGEKSASVLVSRDSTGELGISTIKEGAKLHVGLRRYHTLKPAGLKLLVVAVPGDTTFSAVKMGKLITELSHGTITLLNVAMRSADIESSRKELNNLSNQLFGESALRLFHKSRAGVFSREVVIEAQEGLYDLVILPKSGNSEIDPGDWEAMVSGILKRASTPVMLAANDRPLERILVCTAAGEPGKRDVLFGARLGRHTKSATTVLHVPKPNSTEEDKVRAERHLVRAQAVLESYNVSCVRKLKQGDVISQIREEAKSGNYDLVLLGASGRVPGSGEQQFSLRVGGSLDSSLVVVPAWS